MCMSCGCGAPNDDHGDEREADRIGGMSAEDRDWESASQDRNRRAQERDATAPTDAGDDQR